MTLQSTRMVQLERFTRILKIFLIASLLFGFYLAIEAPDDVLTRFPVLAKFTAGMKYLVPVIGKSVAQSSFPQVTELYLSLSWAIGLLWPVREITRYSLAIDPDIKRSLVILNSLTTWQRIRNILISVLILIVYCFFYDGGDFRAVPFNSSRITLGLAGWVIPGGGGGYALFLGFVVHVAISIKRFSILHRKEV